MDDQPAPSAPPQYSPDGRWWWDGQQWVAVAPAAKRQPSLLLTALLFILGIGAGLVALQSLFDAVFDIALGAGVIAFLSLYFGISRTRRR